MSPRFHRSPPPAASAADGPHHLVVGGVAAISRVPRFAAAVIDRPVRPDAAADTHGALCHTLTHIVDTFAARGKDPQPPQAPRVGSSADGPPPARTSPHRAPLQATTHPDVAGP